jgi:hypothetical protein
MTNAEANFAARRAEIRDTERRMVAARRLRAAKDEGRTEEVERIRNDWAHDPKFLVYLND